MVKKSTDSDIYMYFDILEWWIVEKLEVTTPFPTNFCQIGSKLGTFFLQAQKISMDYYIQILHEKEEH
jgi:hypothetical protein